MIHRVFIVQNENIAYYARLIHFNESNCTTFFAYVCLYIFLDTIEKYTNIYALHFYKCVGMQSVVYSTLNTLLKPHFNSVR